MKRFEKLLLEVTADPETKDNLFKLVFVIKGSEVYTKNAQRHAVTIALREGMPLSFLPDALEGLAKEIREVHGIEPPIDVEEPEDENRIIING